MARLSDNNSNAEKEAKVEVVDPQSPAIPIQKTTTTHIFTPIIVKPLSHADA